MYVDADARGSGLATRLLDTAEAHARAAGAQRMILWTDTRFTRAHGFYEKFGYVRQGSIRILDDVSNSLEFRYAKPAAGLVVEALDAAGAASAERRLAALLIDCVADGASLTFLPPLSRERAMGFWKAASAAVAAGSRVLLAAWLDGRLAGCAILDLATEENTPDAASIRTLMVDPAARRRGIGRALMRRAEQAARAHGAAHRHPRRAGRQRSGRAVSHRRLVRTRPHPGNSRSTRSGARTTPCSSGRRSDPREASPMISPDWCRMMAAYNAEMNRRLYRAADGLDDAARRADRGAFWGSLHGTLSHLLWGDTQWMSRFDGWEKPATGIKDSAGMVADWGVLKEARFAADARIEAWAAGLTGERLAARLVWFSSRRAAADEPAALDHGDAFLQSPDASSRPGACPGHRRRRDDRGHRPALGGGPRGARPHAVTGKAAAADPPEEERTMLRRAVPAVTAEPIIHLLDIEAAEGEAARRIMIGPAPLTIGRGAQSGLVLQLGRCLAQPLRRRA